MNGNVNLVKSKHTSGKVSIPVLFLLFLVIGAVSYSVFYFTGERYAVRKIKAEKHIDRTIYLIREYLSKYPNGDLASEVDDICFKAARSHPYGGMNKYPIIEYVKLFPGGKHFQEADDIFFDIVKKGILSGSRFFQSDLHDLLVTYCETFPDGKHKQEAEDIFYENCVRNLSGAAGDYIKLFPDGRHMVEMDDALYRMYGSSELYIKLLPNGKNIARAGDKFFREARESRDLKKFEFYLKTFPKDRHCEEIEKECMNVLKQDIDAIRKKPVREIAGSDPKDIGGYEKTVIEKCEIFLRMFPASTDVPLIRETIEISRCRIDFFKSASSPSGILGHLKRMPASCCKEAAEKRFIDLASGNGTLYSEYLKAFPSGIYAEDARNALEYHKATGFYSEEEKKAFEYNEVKKKDLLEEYVIYVKKTKKFSQYTNKALNEIAKRVLPMLISLEKTPPSSLATLTLEPLINSPPWQIYALCSSWNGISAQSKQLRLCYGVKDNGIKSTGKTIYIKNTQEEEKRGSLGVTLELYSISSGTLIFRKSLSIEYSNFRPVESSTGFMTGGNLVPIEEDFKETIRNIQLIIKDDLTAMGEKLLEQSAYPVSEISSLLENAPKQYHLFKKK